MAKEDALAFLVADIYEAAGALRQHGDRLAATVGQTQARWQVLSVVSQGDWTISTAARRLGITRQSVRRVADLLVGDGLASYESNPRHKGSPLVRLTEQGRAALEAINGASLTWRRTAAEGIAEDDLRIAREVLQAILERLAHAGSL